MRPLSRPLIRPGAVVVLAAGILGLSVAGAVAYAAIPDSSGVIHGCYNPRVFNVLRVVDPGATDPGKRQCTRDEVPLAWNQTGPAGPAGPPGAMGPPGPSDAYTVEAGEGADLRPNTPVTVATLSLPAGSYAVSGRAQIFNRDPTPQRGFCGLTTNEVGARDGITLTLPGREFQVFPLQEVVTLSSDRPVEISCNSTADAVAGNATLTAIRVGAVHR